MSSYRVIQVRTLAPFEGGGCSPEAFSLKRGQCGRGYWSHSIESNGSLPPSMGIPLDPLTPALDTPGEFSRHTLFSSPRRASLTLVLKGDRRTRPVGQSALPRGSYGGARLFYLAVEGRAMAVCFLARWAHLFRRVPLQHCVVVEFVASCQGE